MSASVNGAGVLRGLRRAAIARAHGAIPARRLVIVTAVRALIGAFAIIGAAYLSGMAASAVGFGGKMFLFLAVYGLFGHFEQHVMDAVVRAIELMGSGLRTWLADSDPFAHHGDRPPSADWDNEREWRRRNGGSKGEPR